MSHMVIFQAPGGSPGYNQFESLDEAVAFVESLRNDQNVTNARMFALEEIKFELKPFFKVELPALTAGDPSGQAYQGEPAADAAPTESAFGAPVAEEPPQEAPAPALTASSILPGSTPLRWANRSASHTARLVRDTAI